MFRTEFSSLLFGACLAAAIASGAAAQDKAAPESFPFAGGTLTITENEDFEKVLAFDGRELARNYVVYFDRTVELGETTVALFAVGDGGNACGTATAIVWKPKDGEVSADMVGEEDCGAPPASATADSLYFVPYLIPGASAAVQVWSPERGLRVAGMLSFVPQPETSWDDVDPDGYENIIDALSNEAVYNAATKLLGKELEGVVTGLLVGGSPEKTVTGVFYGAGCVAPARGPPRRLHGGRPARPETLLRPDRRPAGAEGLAGTEELAAGDPLGHEGRALPAAVTVSEGMDRMPRRLISTGSPFEKTAGYSRAIVDGDWCFVSGTTGYDYASMTMPEGVEEQTRNCLATIARALEDAGFSMTDVVRARYYVTDRTYVATVFPILGEVFGDVRPAATMVIAALIEPEMKIEIEVTALRRNRD